MEQPQPTATPTDGAAAATQPIEGVQPAAAQPIEPAQSQPAQANDEYAAWLASKSLDPTASDAFEKAAQMAYNSEKLMTKATMEASELKKSLTPSVPPQQTQGDPLVQEMYQDWKTEKVLSEFKGSHPDWEDHRSAMSGLLGEAVSTQYGVYTREQLVNAGLLNLHDIYLQAKGSAPVDTTKIQSDAKQEVLQTLANTQRAGGGNAQASNPNPQSSTEDPITAAIRKSRG